MCQTKGPFGFNPVRQIIKSTAHAQKTGGQESGQVGGEQLNQDGNSQPCFYFHFHIYFLHFLAPSRSPPPSPLLFLVAFHFDEFNFLLFAVMSRRKLVLGFNMSGTIIRISLVLHSSYFGCLLFVPVFMCSPILIEAAVS